MIHKIIIITENPFSSWDYDRLGIAFFLKNRLDVEVWDILEILHTSARAKEILPKELNLIKIRSFCNRSDVIKAISGLENTTMVICWIAYDTNTYFIYRELSRKNIKYCVSQTVSFPNPLKLKDTTGAHTLKRLIKRVLCLHPRDVVHHVWRKILLKHYSLFGINAADVVILTGGEKTRTVKLYPVDKNTHFLWAHALDYDRFLMENKQNLRDDILKGVFLDDYLPFHPDFNYMGIEYPITPEEYYPKICAFFSRLEHELNCKITIAAHPRSHYDELPDYFEGRPIIKGNTVQLVRDSQYVITHMSTALNFAILYQKPIIFVTMDKLQKMDAGKYIPGIYIGGIASELHCTPVNLDHIEHLSRKSLLNSDLTAYDKYRSNYIKMKGTPELPVWEIFILYIKKLI
ncbi:hypothetical protein [Methanoregula sp. UBA64]|jgi:hypothetical protein|uniref:hypothetical protein n=1 Tax=Methanoregula sp. UBA64 TaxID=1915554 RepID=UPI0025F53EB3|nr:hypothetical protein [Methanoregula sp. UBA64]